MSCPVKVTYPVLTKCQNGTIPYWLANTGALYWLEIQRMPSGRI